MQAIFWREHLDATNPGIGSIFFENGCAGGAVAFLVRCRASSPDDTPSLIDGCTIVAALSNSMKASAPASFPNVIGVRASEILEGDQYLVDCDASLLEAGGGKNSDAETSLYYRLKHQ